MQNNERKRRKPKAFVKRYGRIMIGGVIVGILVITAIFAPLLAPSDPNEVNMGNAKKLPSIENRFGTDVFGRDLFSRIIYGTRITLVVALGVQTFVIIMGSICGLLAGYYRRVDGILMRFMEGLAAMPQLLLALVIASVLGPGIFKMMIALVVSALPAITRMMRSQVLSLREKEFIESEKAMGASDFRTIFLHILPHCSSYLLIRFNTGLASTVLALASLSYLGVGLNPAIPNWGAIIADGQDFLLLYPHLVVFPGLAICLTVFGFSMMGEGLRDILDPRLQ